MLYFRYAWYANVNGEDRNIEICRIHFIDIEIDWFSINCFFLLHFITRFLPFDQASRCCNGCMSAAIDIIAFALLMFRGIFHLCAIASN